jgi:hypothetical protein
MKRIGVPFIIAAVCAVALATASTTTAASAAVPIAGTFHPLDPPASSTPVDGTGVAGSISARSARRSDRRRRHRRRRRADTGVGAVTLNLTITQAQGAGLRNVWPCGAARPYASNVNFVRGVDLANQVTVKVGTNGHICIFSSVTTQIIATSTDGGVTGSNRPPASTTRRSIRLASSTLAPAPDARWRRSPNRGGRDSAGVRRQCRRRTPRRGSRLVQPHRDQRRRPRLHHRFPCGTPRPYVSNINFASGVDVANLVTSRIGANVAVCLYSPARADLIMDIEGFFDPWTGALRPVFTPLEPVRVLDTRDGTGVVRSPCRPARCSPGHRSADRRCERSPGRRPLGGPHVTSPMPAVVVGSRCSLRQRTAVGVQLNFVRGIDRANAVKAKIGAGGKVCFYTESQTELVADQFGYFALPMV